MKRNSFCASSFFCCPSVKALHCMSLLSKANLKFAVFCCSATLILRRRTNSIAAPYFYHYCLYEAKLCLRKFIPFLLFSQRTPLHLSSCPEVSGLLVESKADVAAREGCFSPPPSHHLSLTIRLAACYQLVALHSHAPSTGANPTWLHTCAASALLNDAPPRAAAAQMKIVLVRWGGGQQLQENITES